MYLYCAYVNSYTKVVFEFT